MPILSHYLLFDVQTSYAEQLCFWQTKREIGNLTKLCVKFPFCSEFIGKNALRTWHYLSEHVIIFKVPAWNKIPLSFFKAVFCFTCVMYCFWSTNCNYRHNSSLRTCSGTSYRVINQNFEKFILVWTRCLFLVRKTRSLCLCSCDFVQRKL